MPLIKLLCAFVVHNMNNKCKEQFAGHTVRMLSNDVAHMWVEYFLKAR